MLQGYVANVLSVLDVCCKSASCCNINRRRKWTRAEVVPTGVAVPTCVASEAGVGGPHLHAHQQARARSSTRSWGQEAQQVHAGQQYRLSLHYIL